MPFLETILKYLPLIQTGASAVGGVLSGRAQNKAVDRASDINQQATDDAMRIIMGLYDEGQASLAPYKNVGPAALNNLQAMTNRGRVPAPASVQAPPVGNAMARFAPQSSMLGGSGSVTNAMAVQGGSGLRNSLIGAGAGLAAGVGIGSVGGPIGMALGAAGGLIGSQFGKNNPYKAAASRGIDEVSRLIWGTNTPGIPPEQLTQGIVADIIHGRKPVAQGKQESNALLNEWVQGMRDNGTPESVINSSIQTQKQYLSPLRDIFARLEQKPALGGSNGY